MLVKLTAILTLYLFASNITAATYYVDNLKGSDKYTGVEGQPWGSLSRAASTVVAGDTVYIVGNGSNYKYQGRFSPSNSGTPDARISFVGIGSIKPEITNIDQDVILDIAGRSYISISNVKLAGPSTQGVQLSGNSHHIKLDRLTIEGIGPGNGILVHNGHDIEVTNCSISNIGNSGIAFIGSSANSISNTKVDGCDISDIKSNDGITLHKNGSGENIGANHIISRNVIRGAAENGLDITSGTDIQLIENETYKNIQSGILIAHGAKNVTIRKHRSVGDGLYGIIIAESENVELLQSAIIDSKSELYIEKANSVRVAGNTLSSTEGARIDIFPTAKNIIFRDNVVQSSSVSGENTGAMLRCSVDCLLEDFPKFIEFRNNEWRNPVTTGDTRYFSDSTNKVYFDEFRAAYAPSDRFETSIDMQNVIISPPSPPQIQ